MATADEMLESAREAARLAALEMRIDFHNRMCALWRCDRCGARARAYSEHAPGTACPEPGCGGDRHPAPYTLPEHIEREAAAAGLHIAGRYARRRARAQGDDDAA